MQHFFVKKINDEFIFTKEQIFQILNVLRLKINDEIILVNDGYFYNAKITNLKPFEVKILKKEKADNELNVDITLLYCLAKKDKIDLVIQKASELGVNKVVLVSSTYCVKKISEDEKEKKLLRYNKIAIESCEQCQRGKALIVEDVIDFKDIIKYKKDLNLIAYEKEKSTTFQEELLKENKSISVLVGAEGGFSLEEVLYAEDNGFKSISLGKRILRSETAAIYILSILNFYVENVLC